MRICLVSREYPPDTGWGGVGAYTYQVANALVERGHEVHVISLAGNGKPTSTTEISGVTVHRVEYQHLLDELNLFLVSAPSTHFVLSSTIALWRKFLQLHSQRAFDVLEVPEHLAGGIFQTVTASVPTVVKLHTPHSKFVSEKFHGVMPTFDHQMICLVERIGMLTADVLCSPSADMACFVAADLGISPEEIAIVKNPADLSAFSPDGPRALDFDGKPVVLFVGRLEERKGIKYLVEAIPQVLSRHPNARFVILGADTNTAPNGKSMRAYLEQRVRQSGCEKSVDFVSHVPLSEISNYYRSATVCAVPSLYDNAPYTCIEAMACGRPVVTTTAGGSKEYVHTGEMGFVVPPESPEALSQAICALLSNETLREECGENARAFVERELERGEIARQMEMLYELAGNRFAHRIGWYRKESKVALRDALDLLCSYDAMIFETLYKQSIEFRIKHWARFFKARPSLCMAASVVSVAKSLFKLIGRENNLPPGLTKLDQKVSAMQAGRYGLTRLLSEQLQACEIEPVAERVSA